MVSEKVKKPVSAARQRSIDNFKKMGKEFGFKKGNTLSKGYGRPKMTDKQKALALTTRTQFKELLTKYMTLTLSEIEELLEAAELPIIDLTVLKHLRVGLETASSERMDWSIDHIMGLRPTKSQLELSGGLANKNKLDISKLTTEELKVLKKALGKK